MKRVGEVNKVQIDKWKTSGVEVNEISVVGDKTIHVCYVKKPDMDILSAAAKCADEDPVKSGLIMFNSVWLGGDKDIQNDDELKMAAMQQIGSLFKQREASVKKL